MQQNSQDVNVIVNNHFLQQLKEDILEYNLLYICVPFGWGKDLMLLEFYKRNQQKNFFWLEETKKSGLEDQINSLPKTDNRVFLIPRLEEILEQGKQQLIWELVAEKEKNDVFVFASSVSVPELLLPYTLFNKFISYGIDAVRPTGEDVEAFMRIRGVRLTEAELQRIEKDSDNMPLFIQMLSNLLSGSGRGYNNAVKEQCYEDIFTYVDVTFFRSLKEADQNALLKLSCFEELDYNLISYMLDFTTEEVDAFLERMFNKSSILEKSKGGWKFQPLLRMYLDRAICKYFDYEERQKEYKKAMDYLIVQEQWSAAMRFAYILSDKEQLAYCLSRYLQGNLDYSMLIHLEVYFRELDMELILRYPEIVASISILKTMTCERMEAERYERLYWQIMAHSASEGKHKKTKGRLLSMCLMCPGKADQNAMEQYLELLDSFPGCFIGPHYISVLCGEKDFTVCFPKDGNLPETMEKVYRTAGLRENRGLVMMMDYMQAEVLYQRNDMDAALDKLAKIVKNAKIDGNRRMSQLCMIGMMNLMASRNQLSSMGSLQIEKLDLYEEQMPLFTANCQAHAQYYNLLKNYPEPVLHWMKEKAPDETERFYTIQYYQYLIKAKVYIWLEQYVNARMVLQMLFDFATEYEMPYLEAQVRVLKAVIYFREGSDRWKETLIPALEWGKTVGFIRIFADEGAAVHELLNKLAQEEKEWTTDEYLKKVLSASKAHMLQYPKYLKREKQEKLGEFSGSEQAVMRLLLLGERNAEIATRLCVSENTVKYHLKNIYQKLHVKNRSQAIGKVKELELL